MQQLCLKSGQIMIHYYTSRENHFCWASLLQRLTTVHSTPVSLTQASVSTELVLVHNITVNCTHWIHKLHFSLQITKCTSANISSYAVHITLKPQSSEVCSAYAPRLGAYLFVCTIVNALVLQGKIPPAQVAHATASACLVCLHTVQLTRVF